MKKKYLVLLLMCGLVGLGYYFLWGRSRAPKDSDLFTRQALTRRTIKNVVKASGTIEIKDLVKIGSLILGRVDKLLIKENDRVSKGQLLAVIDDGKADTDVLEAQALYEQACAEHEYARKRYERDKQIHEKKFLSDDDFDISYKTMCTTHAIQQAREHALQRAKLLYDHKRIVSPIDGIVISKDISEGETATLTSPATIICTIAQNIENMEVKLEVDENIIAQLTVGHTVSLNFASYPCKYFTAIISDISRAPRLISGAVHYYVTLDFTNKEELFKPGMTVDAEIIIAHKENILSIPTNLFMIRKENIEPVAKILGKKLVVLDDRDREEISKNESKKIIWVYKDDTFYETPIILGITDGSYYEVTSGITDQDIIVVDVPDHDASSAFFKKMFGKGL
jgi:HlyD family secretion protein